MDCEADFPYIYIYPTVMQMKCVVNRCMKSQLYFEHFSYLPLNNHSVVFYDENFLKILPVKLVKEFYHC